MTTMYDIKLAYNHHEYAEFFDWLVANGHEVQVNSVDTSEIVGIDDPDEEKRILNDLWDGYCKSDIK